MTKKIFISTLLTSLLSGNLLSESVEEIIVLEKKLSSLNGWSNNQSITTTVSYTHLTLPTKA